MTPDECSARRSAFVDGPRVRLADGGVWTLPHRDLSHDDPEYDALVAAVFEAEDGAEALRAGLALTIFLLDRNYALGPDALSSLLTFPPGDPDLIALQRDVHALALKTARRTGQAGASAEGEHAVPNAGPFASWWARFLGRLWMS